MAHPIGVTHKIEVSYICGINPHKFGFYCHALTEIDDPIIRNNLGGSDIPLSNLGLAAVIQLQDIFSAANTAFNTINLYRWDTAGPQASWELVTSQALYGLGGSSDSAIKAQQISVSMRDSAGRIAKFAFFETAVGGTMNRYTEATLPTPIATFIQNLLGNVDPDTDIGAFATSRSNLKIFAFYQAFATQSNHIYKGNVGL